MNAPHIGVLALQGDVAEHARALTACGARVSLVRRESELNAVDGMVLPGGESTTIDRLLRIFDLREPLQRRIAQGMPAYGSCAGLILLADRLVDPRAGQQTLGGLDVTVRRNAFGRQVNSFEADLAMGAIARPDVPLRMVFIRAPWIESAGASVVVLATWPGAGASVGPDARVGGLAGHAASERARSGEPLRAGKIVAVRQNHLLGTSFHPEVTGDLRVHELFVSMVREAG
ncbi:pyridoxal 5'-phosphate synthase glutaminase subunit PdxT [Micrococcales bacterium 31B]|nr:pyridoxal 5'-phosphate synthase glutaminase subunit PdxT [Micrococcales bacterium 31B]